MFMVSCGVVNILVFYRFAKSLNPDIDILLLNVSQSSISYVKMRNLYDILPIFCARHCLNTNILYICLIY